MRVAFRVDSSLDIGAGHVMRCLTLAETLRNDGVVCRFLSRRRPGHLIETIRGRGFPVEVLSDLTAAQEATFPVELQPAHAAWLGTDWASDARQSRAVLADSAVDWLIVDHYALDARWERGLRGSCRRLMIIDDLADREHDCDLLLDQNLGRTAADYAGLAPETCEILAGPRYALLRPEFAALRPYSLARRAAVSRAKSILVSMGGVDLSNATGRVLDALEKRDLPQDIVIHVVMGPTAPWLDEVRAHSARSRRATHVHIDVRNMAQLMADADLAIGAAGTTSWERCCLGLPTIVLALAENQKPVAEAVAARGAAIFVGDAGNGPEAAADAMRRLCGDPAQLSALGRSAAECVLGDGAARVARVLAGKIIRAQGQG
jgi:UDP-2,4-diacetamido-2,4,6-trideoxy-beta-L-altropyranose hydrolase